MKRIAVLLLAFFLALPAFGASEEEKLPFVVESQKLFYNKQKRTATYVGSVVAQRGRTIIKGDKMVIYFDSTGKEIKKVIVTGNIYIKDERGEGWCKELVYFPYQEKVILKGNAKLKQDKNLIVGDKIVAYRSGKVEVEGIKRKVKTVIFPEEKGGRPEQGSR